MKITYKWWIKNRPVIFYYAWWSMLSVNLLSALSLSWMGKQHGYEVRSQVLWSCFWALFSYFMLQYWSKYRWNPKEYEKLLKRRTGRTGRRDAGKTSSEEPKQKKDSE